MSPEYCPPDEEGLAPDTNTDDELDSVEPASLPVEEAAPAVAQAKPVPGAPPPLAGPRRYPQHYSLLFGAVAIFIGALSVWERTPVFPVEVRGTATISGAFLMAIAGYCVLVGMLNIVIGRLQGMLASFIAAASALFFGIGALLRTLSAGQVWNSANDLVARGFLDVGRIKEILKQQRIFQATAEQAQTGHTATYIEPSVQDGINAWLGQIGPGVWLTLLGGVIILFVFLKAIFGCKKKAPAAAASTRRRGRR